MPYRDPQQHSEPCIICSAPSIQTCRRCGNAVCREHTSAPGEGAAGEDAPAYGIRIRAWWRRALRGVCLRCVNELEERIAAAEREHRRAQLARIKRQLVPAAEGILLRSEFLQELVMDHAHRRRMRRLLRCFEEERPVDLAEQREFRRRRVTTGICITCGQPASQTCPRCGTALCEDHEIDQSLGRCTLCERAFRKAAGFEPDWLLHPLMTLRYYRQRRRFMEQQSWDPEVFRGD